MNSAKDTHMQQFPVVIDFPIDWGDMDAFQHVNNIMYFRYFENARIAYFEQTNITQHMQQTKLGPILADTYCRYRVPLTYPDTVSVGARVTELQKDRFAMEYIVYSNKLDKVAAKGTGLVVYYDYGKNSKTQVPNEIREHISHVEGREF
ncbi:acyl-CoA thioesterase [Candidatus Uabimicrobium amorphum]|uniref:Thioesterase n=1 Tax=Uabimicrobium amorphum TaxID=2596890 RepID=A0A5S9F2S9_UABAM|nr:thioesterase family protein [Candidatus Uabimicrobium amorphum]BBM83768.1 thioesterase [Candidatus Uabimicrobium amorphum]